MSKGKYMNIELHLKDAATIIILLRDKIKETPKDNLISLENKLSILFFNEIAK